MTGVSGAMKLCVIYDSFHKKNTEKVLLGVQAAQPDIELVKAKDFDEAVLEHADAVGFASGLYFGKLSKRLLAVIERVNSKETGPVFYMYTATIRNRRYERSLQKQTRLAGKRLLGIWFCRGYNSYGPFKLLGGVNRKRPNADDIKRAIAFVEGIMN